jgi:hypothetical protein
LYSSFFDARASGRDESFGLWSISGRGSAFSGWCGRGSTFSGWSSTFSCWGGWSSTFSCLFAFCRGSSSVSAVACYARLAITSRCASRGSSRCFAGSCRGGWFAATSNDKAQCRNRKETHQLFHQNVPVDIWPNLLAGLTTHSRLAAASTLTFSDRITPQDGIPRRILEGLQRTVTQIPADFTNRDFQRALFYRQSLRQRCHWSSLNTQTIPATLPTPAGSPGEFHGLLPSVAPLIKRPEWK